MKFKFIGPPNPGPDGEDHGHDVVVRGRFVGNVVAGGEIDVPDDLLADVKDKDGNVLDPAPVFAESLWQPVAKAAAKKGDA